MINYATCASGILEAWHERDLSRLQDELENAAALDKQSAPTSAELERLELLETIAEQMKTMIAHGTMDQANAYSGLLRHLASDC